MFIPDSSNDALLAFLVAFTRPEFLASSAFHLREEQTASVTCSRCVTGQSVETCNGSRVDAGGRSIRGRGSITRRPGTFCSDSKMPKNAADAESRRLGGANGAMSRDWGLKDEERVCKYRMGGSTDCFLAEDIYAGLEYESITVTLSKSISSQSQFP
jgi:hypothetical protein